MTEFGRSAVPLVSVIVPAYNHEAYLSQALDSIRDEGYPNTEIVLLDDGSTDHTWDVAVGWQKQNAGRSLMTARHQPNAGLTVTLNRLLAFSAWHVRDDACE